MKDTNKKQELPAIPQKIDEYELKKIYNKKKKEDEYILKNKITDIYIFLNTYDYSIWNMIDGNNSISDIGINFHTLYNKLPIQYIKDLLYRLAEIGFIKDYEYDAKKLKPKQSLLQIRFPIRNIGKLFKYLYNLFGKHLFRKKLLFLYTVISVVGIILFFFIPQKPIRISDNYFILVFLYITIFISVFFHELSHAFACLYFKREVKEAGFMLYMLLPVFYVNTSDIWMCDTRPRLIVDMAGLVCDILFGAIFSILSFFANFLSLKILSGVLFYIALPAFSRVIFNLNPLLKWDGYYCLMDILGIYNLKRESSRFLIKELPRKLKNKIKLEVQDYKLIIYAILSSAYILFFISILIIVRGTRAVIMLITLNFKDLDWGTMIIYIYIIGIFYIIIKKIVKTIRSNN